MQIKPKDLVSTCAGIHPVRFCEEVQEIGEMLVHGAYQRAFKVQNLPYLEEELVVVLPWIE